MWESPTCTLAFESVLQFQNYYTRDGPELNFLQHWYYRESTFITRKLQRSTSFKCGSHAPELWVEFQVPSVSWTVHESNIFIASYARNLPWVPLLGLHLSLASHLQISLSFQTLHSPNTRLESPSAQFNWSAKNYNHGESLHKRIRSDIIFTRVPDQ
jgi:hypothetical protein